MTLLLLGRLQLDKGEWTRAKDVFLQACRLAPSCSSWLGAGAAVATAGRTGGGSAAEGARARVGPGHS